MQTIHHRQQETFRKETADFRKSRVQETLQILQEGLREIRDSSSFKEYLRTMSRFPEYSMKNSMLIFRQCPQATFVAGYKTWEKEFSRHVRKGEKGIRILAPSLVRLETEDEEKPDRRENTAKSSRGPRVQGRRLVGYRTIYVFDISQTEGKPLPTFGVEQLRENVEEYETLFEALCALTTFRVVLTDLEEGTNGLTRYTSSTILLDRSLPQLQTIKTLLHEIAHSRLHNPLMAREEDMERLQDSAMKETEAESVAFVVASYFGLDTSAYSFPYLVLWAGKQENVLEKSLERISQTASALIEGLEVQLRKRSHPLLHPEILHHRSRQERMPQTA